MTTLFENYEKQYSILTADITANIGRLNHSSGDDQIQLLGNLDKNFDEANELLEQMDLEVREIDTSQRQKYRTRLDCYKSELKRLNQEYTSAKSKSKSSIINGYESYDEYSAGEGFLTQDQQRRLLDTSEQVERTGNKLNSSYRILLETEQIGSQVLQDLSQQRETIQRSRSKLRETDAELGRSSRVINAMIMRSIQQKIILLLVGGAFVGALMLGIYISVNRNS